MRNFDMSKINTMMAALLFFVTENSGILYRWFIGYCAPSLTTKGHQPQEPNRRHQQLRQRLVPRCRQLAVET